MLFDEAVADFVAVLNAAKKSPHTVAAYRRDLTIVAGIIAADADPAALRLDDIDVRALRRAFGQRAEQASVATMSRTHSAWAAFYRFVVSEGWATTNPLDDIDRARANPGGVRSIEIPDLAVRMLAAADTSRARSAWPLRDVAVVATFAQTGVRLDELVTLTVGARSGGAGERQITVLGKGRKTRTIPITDGLDRRLDRYLAERAERFPEHRLGDHRTRLFVDAASGEAITHRQVQYLIERVYRESGIRSAVPAGALVHALRHTFAMDLLDHGADIVELQTLLGHNSLNTTRRYLTARPDQLRGVIATTAASAAIDAD